MSTSATQRASLPSAWARGQSLFGSNSDRDTAPRAAGPALLHNMSVPPRSQIAHASNVTPALGRRTGYVLILPGGNAMPPVPADASDTFRAAAEAAEAQRLPGRLLALLDGHACRDQDVDPAQAAQELRRRINERAMQLPLPPVAAVCDRPWRDDPCVTDLLDVLTVIAKSSATVYLRDREPNLAAIRDGRRVVVILPPNWRPS